jgi:acetolactate synthase-1/2/3 large subunit
MQMTGAQILMECLKEQGVDTIFGYPGGTILNVYDELYQCNGIRHILTAHEQGAAHAADGYARSTGRVGVCFATSGPGATNLTTGIATAYMDSSPVVFITCNVSENLIGKDSFQEVDITGITMPITKSNYMVRDVEKLAETVREAFAIARSGRPGPVLLDILKNVTAETAEFEPLPRDRHFAGGRLATLKERAEENFEAPRPNADDLEEMVRLIDEAKKPLIICGGGVVRGRAQAEFAAFAEKLDAPVAITLMGGGGYPGDSPLSTGMLGMHGSQASNRACASCDLLIAVGCRFSDRVALNPDNFARQAKIVQIDIDRSEINKNVKTDHHIVGDAAQVLDMLYERIQRKTHEEWKRYVFAFPTETLYEEGGDALSPRQILNTIQKV